MLTWNIISMDLQLVYTEYSPVKSWTVSSPPLYLSNPVKEHTKIYIPMIAHEYECEADLIYVSMISGTFQELCLIYVSVQRLHTFSTPVILLKCWAQLLRKQLHQFWFLRGEQYYVGSFRSNGQNMFCKSALLGAYALKLLLVIY